MHLTDRKRNKSSFSNTVAKTGRSYPDRTRIIPWHGRKDTAREFPLVPGRIVSASQKRKEGWQRDRGTHLYVTV